MSVRGILRLAYAGLSDNRRSQASDRCVLLHSDASSVARVQSPVHTAPAFAAQHRSFAPVHSIREPHETSSARHSCERVHSECVFAEEVPTLARRWKTVGEHHRLSSDYHQLFDELFSCRKRLQFIDEYRLYHQPTTPCLAAQSYFPTSDVIRAILGNSTTSSNKLTNRDVSSIEYCKVSPA